ncbi:Coenzyme F420 hydrogenase/dehydrogenase, beta subunit C-terminal domain, partial [Dehalococcoidales bacterium]|nr:Coenzyme F420 hydrogenase/dehydrogenase, beta subunit C-terminal domain [Dehalococcoidales bacterium]
IFGKEPEDALLGNYLNCYIGHATDYDIRYNSASGGLATALLVFALEQGVIDGALVTRMSQKNPLEPEPFIARTREEIISAAKSKYCPVAANVALREILEQDGRLAVVGLPCHIQAIRKAEMVNKKLRERIALHIGIFCGHSDRFTGTEFLLQRYGIKREEISQIHYRGQGWPGAMTIYLKDGKKKLIPFDSYIIFHGLCFFIPMRCTLCCDSIAELADITLMDAWLPEVLARDDIGSSIAVCRTQLGETLCHSAKLKGAIELEELPSSKVAQSQGMLQFSHGDLAVRFSLSRLFGHATPRYNQRLPRPRAINYPRALIVYFNMWLSSKRYLWKLITPLAWLESRILRLTKS